MTKIKTKSLRQTTTFKTTPHEVYEALMDSRKHAKFTGGKARISRKVGTKDERRTTNDEQGDVRPTDAVTGTRRRRTGAPRATSQ